MRQYGVVAIATALGLGSKLLLAPLVTPDSFVTIFAAVLVSAAYGGLGPGLLATALSMLVDAYCFRSLSDPQTLARIILFLATGSLVSWGAETVRAAYQRLEEAERRYRRLFDSDLLGILFWHADGRITDANERFLDTIGYTRTELNDGSLRWPNITPPEYAHLDARGLAEVHASGGARPYEKEFVRPDGHRVPVIVGGRSFNEGGDEGVAFVLDITALKRTEDALRRSEARFRRLFDANTVGVLFWDADGGIPEANDAFLQMVGYTRDDLAAGRVRWKGMTPPEYAHLDVRGLEQIAATGVCDTFEKEYIHKDGHRVPIATSGASLDASGRTGVSFVFDLSERKRIEEALAAANQQLELRVAERTTALESANQQLQGELQERTRAQDFLRAERDFVAGILDTIDAFVVVCDLEGRIIRRSLACDAADGRTFEQVQGRHIQETAETDEEARLSRALFETIVQSETPTQFESDVTRNGRRFAVAWSSCVLRDAGIVVSAGIDITQRKLAEESLRTSEARFQRAFDGASIGMALVTLDGRALQINRALCDMLGYSEEELLPKLVRDLMHPDDFESAQADLQRLLTGEVASYQAERRYFHKSGEVVWTQMSVSLVRDRDGEPLHTVSQLQDITARKHAESALAESRERYRQVSELTSDYAYAFRIEPDGRVVFEWFTGAFSRITGFSAEEIRGVRGIDELIHPDDRGIVLARVSRLQAGEPDVSEFRMRTKAGDFRWLRDYARPERDERSGGLRIVGAAQDITDRKLAEAAQRASEERFQSAFLHAPVGMVVSDLGERPLQVNRALCEMLGYSEAELLAQPIRSTTHPADLVAAAEQLQQLRAGTIHAYQGERRYIHRLGHEVWAAISVSLVRDASGQPLHIVALLQNITERKRIDQALRQSEERFSNAFEHAPIGMAMVGLDGRSIRINRAMCQMLGYSEDELIRLPVWEVTHPEDMLDTIEHLRRLVEGKIDSWQLERRYFHQRGHTVWGWSTSSLVRAPDGTPLYVISQVQDITERRRAEEARRESEERFALAVAGANDGLWDWNLETNETYRSPRWAAVMGFQPAEVSEVGTGWDDVAARLHPEDRQQVSAAVNAHLAGLSPVLECEYRLRHQDGSYRWVLSRGVAIRDANGKPYRMAGSLTDVTARKRSEEDARQRQAELAHALRVSTLGEMAAGLAHELNQPLSAIVSYARGCVRRLQTGSVELGDLVYVIEQVATQALRAGEVLQRHRQFLRSGPPQREWVQLNTLVRAGVGFAHTGVREHATRVRLDLADLLPRVQVDSVQIEQVVVNLVRNALDAMQGNGGGEIWVRTALGPNGIEVAVQDAGCGMTAGLCERVFDAFFTTKPNGLGMGLSISRSIIEAHGGRLWAMVNPDQGTTFRFVLPAPSLQVQSCEAAETSADDR